MFISSAYAQAAGGGASDAILQQLLLFVPLIAIFYFLLIRPQQKRAAEHKDLIAGIRRGDQVILASGILGKVKNAKDGDTDIDVEIAPGTVVKVIRATVSGVRGKTDAKDAKEA
jgi:preprotein translocase subunit YajC